MKHIVAVAVLLAVAVSVFAIRPCLAAEVVIYGGENEKPAVRGSISGPADVSIDGVTFFTIPGPAIGYSTLQRLAIVETRIAEILSTSPFAPVTVKPVRGKPTVYVGNIRLITVYPADVRNAGAKSAAQLAAEWAEGTAAALQVVAPSAFRPMPRGRSVYVLGLPWFDIYTHGGFPSMAARVESIRERINAIARDLPGAAAQVNVRYHNQEWTVFVGDSLLITATDKDACGNGVSSAKALAGMWAQQARKLFDAMQLQ